MIRASAASWQARMKGLACTAAAALHCSSAHALQVIEARDGVAVEAIVSIKEPTRIRIEGAPILDVVGNVQAGNCAAAAANGPLTSAVAPAIDPQAEAVVECDRERGEIYIRPHPGSAKPVNLFVSSQHATYTLILRRADTPADTIVLRDRSMRDTPATRSPAGAAAGHVKALKALLVAMAQESEPADLRVEALNQPLLLWQEARFTLVRRYEGGGLVGEKYQLQNITARQLVLAEQEFDRPDAESSGQVLAVALDRRVLQPLETTQVYVIRRGGDR